MDATNRSSIAWNPALTDEYEGHVIIIITTVMTVLVVLSTTTRIGMKLWSQSPLKTEDFLILVSLVSRPLQIQQPVGSCYRP
jgi:hypothetical protein